MTSDLELLRRYEPVARFTYGEHFFPMDVNRYIAHCSLWRQPPRAPAQLIIPEGELTLEYLNTLPPDAASGVYFLHFVEPAGSREQHRCRTRPDRPRFKARGRLARVGLLPRLIDAMFTVTLWMRGTVPGGTALAAEDLYCRMQQADERYVYYGRVLQQDGYTVLHYLYFYCMNDWRSSFYGVNDHEADWEQVFIYLETRDNGDHQPVWVAYAAHDGAGDDLRRHWDDPQLEKVGTHPVMYVGAGSHAGYFQRGEYLVTVSLSPFRLLIRLLEWLQHFWRFSLRQGDPEAQDVSIADFFRIPFVDYARGDGVTIGPDAAARSPKGWTPELLDADAGWVQHYRGLWGLFARDPVSGENAPAGPKFNRDGSVRRSWHNPLGWSGLQKVAPPSQWVDALTRRIVELNADQARDQEEANILRRHLAYLYLEYRALAEQPRLENLYQHAWVEVEQHEERLNQLRDAIAARAEIIQACLDKKAALDAGKQPDLRVHIQHEMLPQSEEEIKFSAFAESWAAFSVGLLLIALLVLILISDRWIEGLALLLAVFALLDSIFRGHFRFLILRATLGLASLATLVLIYEYFWEMVITGVTATSLLIIIDNVRELRR